MSESNISRGMFGVSGTGDTSGYSGLERIQVTPGSSERPYGSYFDEVADDLERAYPEFAEAIEGYIAADRLEQGEWQEAEFEGYNCKCFLHELDHLEGIVFQDRVSQLKWNMAVRKSKKRK